MTYFALVNKSGKSTLISAHIHIEAPQSKFIEDDVSHQVRFFKLPKLQSGVAQTNSLKVILMRRSDVFAPLNVKTMRSRQ